MINKSYRRKGKSGIRAKKFKRRGYRKTAKTVNVKRQVHYFTRRCNLGGIVSVGINTPTLTSFTFKLDNVPNVSDFTALFDQYKMTKIELFFKLMQDPSAQNNAQSWYPTMYYCVDHDDATAPTSINDLLQHGRTQQRIMKPNSYIKVVIKPAVLFEVARGTGTTTVSPQWNQWIDMAHVDTLHYGLKYAFDNSFNINPNYSVEVFAKYHFACRDTR